MHASASTHQPARIGRRTSALHASAGMHRHSRFTGVKNVLVHAPLAQCAPVSLMSYPLSFHCATDCMRAACLHLPCMRRLRHAPARTSSVPAPPVKYAGLPRPHSPRSAHAMTGPLTAPPRTDGSPAQSTLCARHDCNASAWPLRPTSARTAQFSSSCIMSVYTRSSSPGAYVCCA